VTERRRTPEPDSAQADPGTLRSAATNEGPDDVRLRAEVERTRLILETANDAYIAMNEDGRIVDWNGAAEQTFGWSMDEACGQVLAELIIPPSLRQAHEEGLARFLSTGEGPVLFETVELHACRRNGESFPVELTIWPNREADGSWLFNAFVRDISDRRRAEEHRRLLLRVAEESNAATEIEPAVRTALAEIAALTGWPVGHAYLTDADDRGKLLPTGWWVGLDDARSPFGELTAESPFDIGEGLPGRVAASGLPEFIVDLTADENFPRAASAADCGLQSAFGFPVMVESRTVGVLEFYSTDKEEPHAELLELMRNVGVQLGRVFERAHARRELRSAAEFRSELVSMVSHELRGPLSAIGGFVYLLNDEWENLEDEDRISYLGSIGRQVSRLTDLVENLLTLSRVNAGVIEPRPEPVDVHKVISETIRDFDLTDVRVLGDSAVSAWVDRDHLTQMLANLLTNASLHGEPPISVEIQEHDDEAVVRVRDEGPGVPDELAARLFTQYARGDRRGTGLGLSIVDGIARANNGEVRYQPNEPRGSCFMLRLPVESEG
jgi:PAS domain S-box-containing protein